MSSGQLVIVSAEVSPEQYGMIVQVMSSGETEDSYIVLVGTELLILTGADIAEI
jgi:hypothetical protein|tara:strand:- start:252 stop:413 length:162 start_codon:yes stop_codon:yes gene_type:complete